MEIRPLTQGDLGALVDIDGTVDSAHYLHVESAGEGLGSSWRMEERSLRQRVIDPNPMREEDRFSIKQLALGIEEGVALVAEHDRMVIGLASGVVRPSREILEIVDLRIDFEHRRQGLGTAMIFRCIQEARDRGLRAVLATTRTNNLPAARFLHKSGFEIGGLDTRMNSNHDLVKEAVSLFWYAALD